MTFKLELASLKKEFFIQLILVFFIIVSQIFNVFDQFPLNIIFTLFYSVYLIYLFMFTCKKGIFVSGYLKLFLFFSIIAMSYLLLNTIFISMVKIDAISVFLLYLFLIITIFIFIQFELEYDLIAIFIFILGLIQIIISLVRFYFFKQAFSGTYGNPEVLGAFLIFVFYCGISLLKYRSKGLKISIYISMVLIFLIFILYLPLSALISFYVSLVIMAFFKRKYVLGILLLLFVMVIILIFKRPFEPDFYENMISNPKINVKTNAMSSSIDMIKHRSMLGVGLGNFKWRIIQYRRPARFYISAYSNIPRSSSNLILKIASEMGIMGFILLFIMFLPLFRYYKKGNEIFAFFGVLIFSMFSDIHLDLSLLIIGTMIFCSKLKVEDYVKRRFDISAFQQNMFIFIFFVISLYTISVISSNRRPVFWRSRFTELITSSYVIPAINADKALTVYKKIWIKDHLNRYISGTERSLNKNPFQSKIRREKIMVMLQYYKDRNELIREMEKLSHFDPYNVFNYEFIADVFLLLDDKENARLYLKKAIELEIYFARAIFKLGKINRDKKMIKKAYDLSKEFVEYFSERDGDGEFICEYEYMLFNLANIGDIYEK